MTGDEKSRLMFWLGLYQVTKKERDQMLTSEGRLGIIPKPSQIKFHHIRITKPKVKFMFKFQHQNGKKQKSVEKNSRLQNGTIRELQIKAGFRDCK